MKLLIILAIVFFVGGCEVEKATPITGPSRVTIFHLEDGTKCALYDGFRAGGLSCDWGGNSR